MKRVRNRRTRRKKLCRKSRRRQQGGMNVVINGLLTPSTGNITATSSDPTISLDSGANTITITNITGAIRDIQFAGPTSVSVRPSKIGVSLSDTGIHVKDNKTKQFIVVKSSSAYTSPIFASQTKLNSTAGYNFTSGITISNLNASNLDITGNTESKFTITLVM